MAITKKGYIWIFSILAVIAIIAIIYYVVSSKKVPDPNKSNIPLPAGSPSVKWLPETFSLDLGMYGPKIKALQKALGIPDDGKFGSQTKAAVKAKGYDVPLSLSDYNAIVSPASVGGSGTQTKGVYAKYDNTIVRNKDLSPARVASKNQWLGLQTGVDDSNGYYELDNTYYVIKNMAYLVG